MAVIRRTLQWMATHSPEEIVAAMRIDDTDKKASLLRSLKRYPHQFSADGKISTRQIAETDRFFAVTAEATDKPVALETMIDARWAGRMP